MKKTYTFFLLISLSFSFAQTKEQLKEVINNTNVSELSKLKDQFNKEYQERQERINAYLSKNPSVKRKTNEDGVGREIYDVLNNEVWYYSTANRLSAQTARANKLYLGGSLSLNVQGQGMTAGVWDEGPARNTHQEFPNNKVTLGNTGTFSAHSTHVTGTVVAKGLFDTAARGIAFDASAISYNWDNDYAEMTDEAALGLLVSNHSYWIGTSLTSWQFGAYDSRARQLDEIAFNAPNYLPVCAAGNDRNATSPPAIVTHLNAKGGYNLIRGMNNAKNFLTVGAVKQVPIYTDAEDVVMSPFSSWGPTDDGRIKPDVVAKGMAVWSTLETSNTAYGNNQGTSMASPAVAGVALLLQQHYHNVHGSYMKAASLKGLINHTADEAGDDTGPDYRFGWGLINAEKSAVIISDKATNTAVIEELTLNNTATYTKTISVSGTDPLMVSISWTDRPGTANNGTVDPTTSNLVNDLDVRVTKNGQTHFPWTLNPVSPSIPAVRTQDNFRDNFEKIQVDNASGTYTITVTHKGTLVGGSQNFSLIASGTGMNLDAEEFVANTPALNIFPNPAVYTLNFETNNWNEISNIAIIDVTGKVINAKYDVNQKSIDVSDLQSGVYFVKFTSDNKSVTKKFIKK